MANHINRPAHDVKPESSLTDVKQEDIILAQRSAKEKRNKPELDLLKP